MRQAGGAGAILLAGAGEGLELVAVRPGGTPVPRSRHLGLQQGTRQRPGGEHGAIAAENQCK